MGVPGTWFREYTGWRSNLHPSKGPFEDKLFQYLIKLSPSPASLKICHFHLICHGISRRRVETPVGKYFTYIEGHGDVFLRRDDGEEKSRRRVAVVARDFPYKEKGEGGGEIFSNYFPPYQNCHLWTPPLPRRRNTAGMSL